MLSLSRDQAERIAYVWIRKQETALNLYGGYPGNLYVVRDMLVSFINCNGEKYDGPSVSILTQEEALEEAENSFYFDDIDEDDQIWRQYQTFFGEDVKSLADYLISAK